MRDFFYYCLKQLMDNQSLAGQFVLLSKLMTLHEENPFKIRSYTRAATQIERHPLPVMELPEKELGEIPGIGAAIKKKIEVLKETGHFPLLEKYLENTPPGIVEMLHIKGIGPKKLVTIWKNMGIETPGELLYACHEDQLTRYKGFGAKTQENIRRSIDYYLHSQGQYLLSEALSYVEELQQGWFNTFPEAIQFLPTGALRRQENTLSELRFITNATPALLKQKCPEGFKIIDPEARPLVMTKAQHPKVVLYCENSRSLVSLLFKTTGTTAFLNSFYKKYPDSDTRRFDSEEALFKATGCPYIPPYLRNWPVEHVPDRENVIQTTDIQGIIHAHSDWSDGRNTLEEMALEARKRGMAYLVISDHSRSAGYANGLSADRILEQQKEIDALNQKLAPFRIFKSVESDILSDGALDYEEDILKTFDLVIASVHSNLKMDKEKAMQRLLKAIENPYTTILGHPTGRLLLSRPGYPLDHEKIIEACAKHKVAIEINAHPRRLDLDWSWIPLALKKGVLLSVDPDAHSLKGLQDVRFGVLSAQKGGLPVSKNLSSFSLQDMEAFLLKRKKDKNLTVEN